MLLLLIVLFCFKDGISGNDFWWHVKAGEWVCTHRAVPVNDIFSWYGTEQNIPWIAHEWLAEILFCQIFRIAGSEGIYLFSLMLGILFLGISYLEGRQYIGRNVIFCGIFYSIYAVSIYMFFYGRPQIFGFLLSFVELKILYCFYHKSTDKGIYFIPVLACLWSNLHGGSSCMAYVLCFAFLTAGVFEFRVGRVIAKKWDRGSLVKLLTVTIVTVGAILINPIGVNVLKYPYINLSDDISMKIISEWASPDAKEIGQLVLFFLPIALMIIGFITEEVEIRFIDLLILVMFLYLFFRSERFFMMWSISAIFSCMRYVPKIQIREMTTKTEKLLMTVLIVATSAACIYTVSMIVSNIQKGKPMVQTEMSDEMLEAVKKQGAERLFNEYNYSGELIFHDIPVFWDSRADLFAAAGVLEDAANLMYLQNTTGSSEDFADKMIEKYGFDSFLVTKERPFCTYLLSHPECYSVRFQDENAMFFIKIQ